MKKRKILLTLLSVVAMIFLSLSATTATQAQTPNATAFSGDATGVIANAKVLGGGAVVNATVAPTGALPTTGGRLTNGVLTADVFAGLLGTTNTLTTGVVTTRTSGGVVADGGNANTSQSQAQVANLNLGLLNTGVLGINVTADLITANTACSCGPACTGNSQIVNLRVGGRLVGGVGGIVITGANVTGTITATTDLDGNVTLTATPNSTITVNVAGVGRVVLTLNQQTSNGAGDITVNALRIQANVLSGTVTADVIVAQAHSDITCAAVVAGSANLALTKTSTITGSVITNTITVTNNGPDTATGVVITDALPAGTTFVSATGSTGVVVTNPTIGSNGTVTGSLATLASGGTATLTIVSNVAVGTAAGTSIANTATVTSTTTDPDTANNTATFTVVFQPVVVAAVADLSTLKSCTINGNTITCTITVTNNGPNTATNVVIMDMLPTQTLFGSSFGSAGVTLVNPTVGQSGTVTGTLPTLASGASATITVVSNVNPDTAPGTVVTNTATATSDSTDLVTINNTASVNILVGIPVAPGNTPIFSGRAIGTFADINGVAVIGARLADTGPLPQTGGRLTATVASANVSLGGIGTLATGVINTRTSGGAPGIVDGGNVFSSQSQAVVNDLVLSAAGLGLVTATTLTANTMCGTGTPTCTGNSIITGLTVNGVVIPADVIARAAAQPNTAITVNVAGVGVVTVILNEQIIGNSSITVNAVHVIVTNLAGLVTANVVIASAESDIAFPPTAAIATVRGRVLSPSGRGIARARIFLTNSMGEKQTAVTNPFGYFSFEEINSGENYVVEVTHKSYIFTPQVLLVINDLTELNFTGLPYGKSGGKSKFIPVN